MKRLLTIIASLVVGMCLLQSCSTAAKSGPNGGDVVPLADGKTNAEVMANSDTGEAMVHTLAKDTQTTRPIEARPLTLGTDGNSVRLDPYPISSDPPGSCSQFYGHADWLRGGNVHHGWLSNGTEAQNHFDWKRCWSAGGANAQMWSGMGVNRPGMGGPRPGGMGGPGMGGPGGHGPGMGPGVRHE